MNRQEAIDIVKKNWPDSSFTSLKEALEFLIPELMNTDDEKIKEAIIKGITHAAEEGCFCADNYSVKECVAWIEKQGGQPKKLSIWKHWKNGVCGNGEGKLIYLVKVGGTYRLTSSLAFECDYIELSELDSFMLEKQGGHANFCEKIQVGDKVTRNEDGVLVNLSQLKRVAKKDEKQGEQKPVEPQQDMLSQEKYAKAVDKCIYGEQKPVNVDYVSGIREELLSIEDSAENIVGLTESQWVAIRAAYRLLGEYIAKEQKLADKVEPKFKVGDCIRHKGADECYIIVTIDDNYYFCENNHAWSIRSQDCFELVEQKSYWGEEDCNRISSIKYLLHELDNYNFDNWLNSLKERVKPRWKPSKRQKEALLWCVVHFGGADKQTLGELLEELNKL